MKDLIELQKMLAACGERAEAERFIESRLAQLALKRRLAEKRAAAPQQQQSNIGNGHDDWARKHYDDSQQQADPHADLVAWANGPEAQAMLEEGRQQAEPAPRPNKGDPMLDAVLKTPSAEFDAWVKSLPYTYWARYDLSACRVGWEAGRAQPRITAEQIAEIKRLADEYGAAERDAMDAEPGSRWYDLDGPAIARDKRAALHAALDALVKGE